MDNIKYTFKASLWKYGGPASWYFISLPKEISKEIRIKFHDKKNSFSSIKIKCLIGKSNWNTSIFFNSKNNTFDLPIKRQIREKENILEGDKLQITIEIL